MNRKMVAGWIITGIYVLIFVCLAYWNWRDFRLMTFNELGDFLAGASAPLAFLWLVLGYFQQGEELRLNTKALQAQEDELKHLVEQNVLLAQNSDRQAAASESIAVATNTAQDREIQRQSSAAQPMIVYRKAHNFTGGVTITVENVGGMAKGAAASCDGPLTLELAAPIHWANGENASIRIQMPSLKFPIDFRLTYKNIFGESEIQVYRFKAASFLELVETIRLISSDVEPDIDSID